MEKTKMTEEQLQNIALEIERAKKIIRSGRRMLGEVKNNSIIDYVTEGADTKLDTSSTKPRYVAVPKDTYTALWEAQDKEKEIIDAFCPKIRDFRSLKYFGASDIGDMDILIEQIISYSIKKGYQGTAAMFLQEYAADRAIVGAPYKAFIQDTVKQIIEGYSKRTLLTGQWYGDRALQIIYEAQHGDFGPYAQLLPIEELLETFNTACADESRPELTIRRMCDKYSRELVDIHGDKLYVPLTKDMYDKEAARIDKQHGTTRELV